MNASKQLLLVLLAAVLLAPATSRAAGPDEIRLLAVYDLAGAGSDIEWSPDGTRLSATSGANITVLDASSGAAVLELATDDVLGALKAVRWTPNGSMILAAHGFGVGGFNALYCWNSSTGSLLWRANYSGGDCLDISPDGRWRAGSQGDFGKVLGVWGMDNGSILLSEPVIWIEAVAFSSDSRRLACLEGPHAISIWQLSNGSRLDGNLTGWPGNVTSISWSPDGRYLLAGLDDPVGRFNVRLLDALSGEPLGGASYSGAATLCVAWSADGNTIATGQGDGSLMLTVFDGDWADAWTVGNHTAAVTALDWSPDGRFLASASPDGTVRIWGAPGSLPAKRRLQLALEADNTRLQQGMTANLTVRLADDRSVPVPGAVLSFSSDAGGRFYNMSEAGGGRYTATYLATDVRPKTAVNITVNATAAGFEPASGSIRLTVLFPQDSGRATEPAVQAGDSAGYIVAGGGGAILLVAVALALTETGRYSGMLLFIPLFTRMKKAAVLDNFTRGLLQGYIIANPGVHMRAIRHRFDLTNGEVAYHLRVLEREGYITSATDGFRRRFYPGERIDLNDRPQELTVAQNLLISFMDKFPGITGTELARLAGTTPQVVNYHLKKLWRMEVISMDREGRVVRCRVRAEKLRMFNRPAAEADKVRWDGSPTE